MSAKRGVLAARMLRQGIDKGSAARVALAAFLACSWAYSWLVGGQEKQKQIPLSGALFLSIYHIILNVRFFCRFFYFFVSKSQKNTTKRGVANMKQYLCFSREKSTQADGTKSTTRAIPRIRHKRDAYSDPIKTETFSVRNSHLILGADNAGKSRWISKLSKERAAVWRGKNVLAVRSVDALTDWYAQLPKGYRDGLLYPPKTTPERLEIMREWVKGGVLLVDDVHRATGRKVDYLHELISSAKVVVASATSHQKMHPKLRHTMMSREPQIHDLASTTAYDATQILVWVLVVLLVIIGAGEAAILLGGASMLRGGARSRAAV